MCTKCYVPCTQCTKWNVQKMGLIHSRYHSLENYLAKMRLVYLKATQNDSNPLTLNPKKTSYIESVTEKFYTQTKSNRVMANTVLPGLMASNGALCTMALGFGLSRNLSKFILGFGKATF